MLRCFASSFFVPRTLYFARSRDGAPTQYSSKLMLGGHSVLDYTSRTHAFQKQASKALSCCATARFPEMPRVKQATRNDLQTPHIWNEDQGPTANFGVLLQELCALQDRQSNQVRKTMGARWCSSTVVAGLINVEQMHDLVNPSLKTEAPRPLSAPPTTETSASQRGALHKQIEQKLERRLFQNKDICSFDFQSSTCIYWF